MSSQDEHLPIWGSLEGFRDEGDINLDLWSPFIDVDYPDEEYIRVYMCRETCVAGVPDEEKRYLLEAIFDAHMERKIAVGGKSVDAYDEMKAYIEAEGKKARTFSVAH